MFPYFYFVLPSYMVMAFIGGFAALLYSYYRSKRFNILFPDFMKIFLLMVAGCFLGAKILYCFTAVCSSPDSLSIADVGVLFIISGYVFYGGLFGSLFMLRILRRKMLGSYSWSMLRNFVAPALPLFHVFGRIGCFLAGCCYGVQLSAPLNIGGMVIERLPTQLIESGYEFLLFAVLVCVDKYSSNINLLKLYLIMYAVFRFFIEFYRDDMDRGFFLFYSTSQWLSLFIIMYYLIKQIMKYWKKHQNAD